MLRQLLRALVVVLIFGAGYLAGGGMRTRDDGATFRLSLNVPAGESRLSCDGCKFLTWVHGRASTPQHDVTFDCASGRCSEVVVAIVSREPRLLAGAEATGRTDD